jgi:hypothetical protein
MEPFLWKSHQRYIDYFHFLESEYAVGKVSASADRLPALHGIQIDEAFYAPFLKIPEELQDLAGAIRIAAVNETKICSVLIRGMHNRIAVWCEMTSKSQ